MIEPLVMIAGIGQLALALGSSVVPRLLRWHEDTARLRPLTRRVFWTYAGYIWVTNICMGALSVLAPEWLVDGSPLARALAAYIGLYWGARLLIQFVYFDRADGPTGLKFVVAESALVGLFVFLTAVYGYVAVS